MNSNIHPFYSHSGKFGLLGPLLAITAGALVAYPLGFAYSYLVKWIPFIYLNFLITFGYGFIFGFLTLVLLKCGKVRNRTVALLCGAIVGLLAWYGDWNGHIHALVGKAPWLLTPGQLVSIAKVLLKEGSWALGLFGREPVTGIPLATVWIIEGAAIVGISSLIAYSSVAATPFCETHDCWLDQEKIMDKLDAFTHPNHIEAFSNGDIAPLEEARPRVPASGRFARLTLKHSSKCDDFCALSVANVTVSLDKDGKQQEEVNELMTNLWVPKAMFDYLAQFDRPTARVTTGI
jgi:hypothetical protein